MSSILLKPAVALFATTLALSAAAVEFGPLRLKSALGQPLLAEVEVRADSGDTLNPECIKVFAPHGKQLPVVAGVSLSWPASASTQVLGLRSERALLDPAMTLGLEANCGAGRVWQEFPVLLNPEARSLHAISGSEWIVAPGESPLSLAQLLYPGQRSVQRRFVQALAEANPGLGIAEDSAYALVVGSTLKMPDWRMLGGSGRGARDEALPPHKSPAIASPRQEIVRVAAEVQPTRPLPRRIDRVGPDSTLRLRLSNVLQTRQDANEQLRQILRLEYRLLTSLNEQLSARTATSPVPEGGEAVVAVVTAPEPPVRLQAAPALPPEVPATPAAPSVPLLAPTPTVAELKEAPPSAPVRIRQAPPPLPPPVAESSTDWTYYVGAGAALLILLVLVLRRRAVLETPVFESPDTVLMLHPAPVLPASPENLERFFVEPEAPPPKPVKPVSLPPPEDKADVNPVMELAEIMLSFGRLQGAAQTLQEYIEANPREALQPWMKLLEIYRSGDMHAEFETLAQKLNRNFNVEVQHWDAVSLPVDENADQAAKALSLEELPHIREQLVATWGRQECLDYLHQLLRDNRGGQRSGFTLPVVQEILLLIEILVARQAAGKN